MNDENKNLQDFFGLSEIDKIQAAIEKDLSAEKIPPMAEQTPVAPQVQVEIPSEYRQPYNEAVLEPIIEPLREAQSPEFDPNNKIAVQNSIHTQNDGVESFQESVFDPLPAPRLQSVSQFNELSPKPIDTNFSNFFLVPNADETGERATNYGTGTPEVGFYRETIKSAPKKPWRKFAAAVSVVLMCTLGMGMLGLGIGAGWAFVQNNAEIATGIISQEQGNNPDGSFLTGTSYVFESVTLEPHVAGLSDMVELIAPSVVGITTYRNEREFPLPLRSYGSGVIFADAHDRIFIATNLYVVRRGYRWDISIEGSDPVPAFPVNYNRDSDLAVVYVYKSALIEVGINTVTFAEFGDSDEMRLGEVVLAIGNAMGEGISVTRGIISAAEREVYIPGRRNPLFVLQTDAAINYGNSGGPLINTRGEIVGINVHQTVERAINFGASQAEGMGYSISSNIAAPILNGIVETYRTPAIGIVGVSLSLDEYNMAAYWGIPELGVLVVAVQEGRPAHYAGIRPNDVITGFDGQPIFDMEQLLSAIRSRQIGDTVEVRILRGGSLAITVQLELAIMVRETF